MKETPVMFSTLGLAYLIAGGDCIIPAITFSLIRAFDGSGIQ